MIRIIVQHADRAAAANVGGPVDLSIKTFVIDAPELEAYLKACQLNAFTHRQIIGWEATPHAD